MSDIGYRLKVYSDIRCNVVLRSLQSDIRSSNIKLSPISLITDIVVSAHLWTYPFEATTPPLLLCRCLAAWIVLRLETGWTKSCLQSLLSHQWDANRVLVTSDPLNTDRWNVLPAAGLLLTISFHLPPALLLEQAAAWLTPLLFAVRTLLVAREAVGYSSWRLQPWLPAGAAHWADRTSEVAGLRKCPSWELRLLHCNMAPLCRCARVSAVVAVSPPPVLQARGMYLSAIVSLL